MYSGSNTNNYKNYKIAMISTNPQKQIQQNFQNCIWTQLQVNNKVIVGNKTSTPLPSYYTIQQLTPTLKRFLFHASNMHEP